MYILEYTPMNQVYMLGNIPEITGIYVVYQSYEVIDCSTLVVLLIMNLEKMVRS